MSSTEGLGASSASGKIWIQGLEKHQNNLIDSYVYFSWNNYLLYIFFWRLYFLFFIAHTKLSMDTQNNLELT